MKKRLFYSTKILFTIMAAGLVYAAIICFLGTAVECPFHAITGLLCPGCGVTRMCIALMQLDFHAAFYYNQLIFILLPFFMFLLIRLTYRFIRYGTRKLILWETNVLYVIIAAFVTFGIARNII